MAPPSQRSSSSAATTSSGTSKNHSGCQSPTCGPGPSTTASATPSRPTSRSSSPPWPSPGSSSTAPAGPSGSSSAPPAATAASRSAQATTSSPPRTRCRLTCATPSASSSSPNGVRASLIKVRTQATGPNSSPLGTDHPEVANRLAAVGDRARQIGQHPAPVMRQQTLNGQRQPLLAGRAVIGQPPRRSLPRGSVTVGSWPLSTPPRAQPDELRPQPATPQRVGLIERLDNTNTYQLTSDGNRLQCSSPRRSPTAAPLLADDPFAVLRHAFTTIDPCTYRIAIAQAGDPIPPGIHKGLATKRNSQRLSDAHESDRARRSNNSPNRSPRFRSIRM